YFVLHGSNNDDFVKAVFVDATGAEGSLADRLLLVQALNAGTLTRQQVALGKDAQGKPTGVLASDAYLSQLINESFGRFLKRTASDQELQECLTALKGGMRDEDVIAMLGGEMECYRRTML